MFLKSIICFMCSFLLVSCVTLTGNSIPKEQRSTKRLAEEGIKLMNAKKYKKAREYFSQALKNDPRECHLHFLNALSYQIEGKASNYRLLDMAAVGYQSTIKFCPQEPWSYYYLGLINYQKKNYPEAEIYFAKALKLGQGKTKLPFFEAFIRTAKKNNDHESIRAMLKQIEKVDPKSPLVKKLKRIIRALDPIISHANSKGPEKDASLVISRGKDEKQLLLDAVFILSREIDEELRGVNLLNGLTLQYGVTNTLTRFGTSTWKHYADGLNANPVLQDNSSGSNPALDYSSLITHALSLPAITYNLNIFNSISEHDQIISRPTLLARDKVPAKYFSGTEALIGVSGLNSGQVQIIPLGLNMNITPDFQEDGSINLDIEIGRTFLNEEVTTVGSFESAATALKEQTKTNVNIKFGETVILSSLSETLNAYATNKTPGLGDLPLLRLAFGRKVLFKQNVSLLILITPHEYVGFKNNVRVPDEQVSSVYKFVKNMIEPSSNYTVISKELAQLPIYFQDKILSNEFYTQANIDGAVNSNYAQIDEY
jgi:tetratricopeptide (TPR) repeat protein